MGKEIMSCRRFVLMQFFVADFFYGYAMKAELTVVRGHLTLS